MLSVGGVDLQQLTGADAMHTDYRPIRICPFNSWRVNASKYSAYGPSVNEDIPFTGREIGSGRLSPNE